MSTKVEIAQSQAGENDFSKTVIGTPLFLVDVEETFIMPEPPFEEIKSLYCEKPLSFPPILVMNETLTTEDIANIKDALESLDEHGSISLEDFKKELDL